jgi:hypothetical protein
VATAAGVSSTFLQADRATHDIKASVKTRMGSLLKIYCRLVAEGRGVLKRF